MFSLFRDWYLLVKPVSISVGNQFLESNVILASGFWPWKSVFLCKKLFLQVETVTLSSQEIYSMQIPTNCFSGWEKSFSLFISAFFCYWTLVYHSGSLNNCLAKITLFRPTHPPPPSPLPQRFITNDHRTPSYVTSLLT